MESGSTESGSIDRGSPAEQLHLAMLHSPVAMAVTGPRGELLEVNDAMCAMLGRTTQELLSSRWQDVTHPDDARADSELAQQVLDGKRDTYRLRRRFLHADGTVVHGDVSVVAMRGPDGEVASTIRQVLDVTELVRLQNQYRLIAENISDVVSVGDNDGIIRWLSPSVTASIGWRPEDLVGVPFRDLVHPEDQATVREVQGALLEGQSQQFELRLRTASGDYRWMNIRIRPYFDESGEVIGRVGAWWDVDERRRAADEARLAETRFRAVLDAQLDGQLFLDAVRDGHTIIDFVFVDANPAAARYLRRTRQSIIGQRLLQLFPEHAQSGLFDLYRGVVQSGDPVVLEGIPLVSAVRDGARFFDVNAVKVGDGLSVVWRDVTDRVRAAETLAESERRYRLLADNSADTVLLASPGVMKWLSPALEAMLGYQPQEWVGRRFEEFTHPDDVGLAQARRAEISGGERRYTRLRMRHKNGGYRWVDINAGPVTDPQGGFAGIVATLRAADELVEFETALAQSEAQARAMASKYEKARDEAVAANLAKTTFLSRMSHELRTPLNAILGFAQLLSMDSLGRDQAEAVAQIQTGGKHLLDLINEILDISRIEAGEMALSIEPVRTADVISEAVELVRSLADASGVAIAAGADEGWLLADHQRTIQILINLLGNAIKYAGTGSHVEVLGTPGRISVTDDGPGISVQDQAVIFNAFERLGAEARGIEGTGVGLTLSRRLAQAMGGTVELESEPGRGSTFTVVLPETQPLELTPEVVVAVSDPVEPRGLQVVYVEDNLANALLMRRVCALRGGVSIDVGRTGQEGLELARQVRPGLLLVDLHLPDMSGLDVLTAVRAELPETRIVMVTADATASARATAHEAGADGFVTKPIDVAQVLGLLDASS